MCDAQWAQYNSEETGYVAALAQWEKQFAAYQAVDEQATSAAIAYQNFSLKGCEDNNPFRISQCMIQEQKLKTAMQNKAAYLKQMYPNGAPPSPTPPTPPNCTPSPGPSPKPSPPTPGPPGPTPHHQTYNPLPIIQPYGTNWANVVPGNPPSPQHADELPVIAVMGVLIMGLIYWGTTR